MKESQIKLSNINEQKEGEVKREESKYIFENMELVSSMNLKEKENEEKKAVFDQIEFVKEEDYEGNFGDIDKEEEFIISDDLSNVKESKELQENSKGLVNKLKQGTTPAEAQTKQNELAEMKNDFEKTNNAKSLIESSQNMKDYNMIYEKKDENGKQNSDVEKESLFCMS